MFDTYAVYLLPYTDTLLLCTAVIHPCHTSLSYPAAPPRPRCRTATCRVPTCWRCSRRTSLCWAPCVVTPSRSSTRLTSPTSRYTASSVATTATSTRTSTSGPRRHRSTRQRSVVRPGLRSVVRHRAVGQWSDRDSYCNSVPSVWTHCVCKQQVNVTSISYVYMLLL